MVLGMHPYITSNFADLIVVSCSHGTHCAGVAVSGP